MTVEEIANELGVSKSTVSRALSGKGRIGKATVARIQAYVSAQNVTLRNQAQHAQKQDEKQEEQNEKEEKKLVKTGNIGVVIPADAYTTSIPFFQECLLGISEAASSENYNVLITTGTATDYFGVKQMVEDRKVDGVILMRSSEQDLALDYLIKQNIPVGLTGHCSDENVIQVDSDNCEASRRMTSMLIDCGYKKFALIVGESSYRVNHDRIDGFYQAIDHYGLLREQQLCVRNFKWMGIMDSLIHDIMSGKVECVICGDDVICSRMMSRLQAEGYRIPLDIGIASLYNGATLDCFTPAVTAVNILARQQGITIGKQMIHCLKGELYNKKTMLDYEILLRKSAGRTF